ncbi:MAG: polymer-forming cytoskeletal protein [Phycisphaerales bacterium]|nr:polymer-forming cytoskeletal protein [Phycisphaerales bacterium]
MLTLPTKTLRTTTCYHCHRAFDASSHAIILTCKHCYQRVELRDITIHSLHQVARLETAGNVLIERKGDLRCTHLRIGDRLEVQGAVRADCLCDGPVILGPKSRWHGNLLAPAITIAPGAIITGGHLRIGHPAEA